MKDGKCIKLSQVLKITETKVCDINNLLNLVLIAQASSAPALESIMYLRGLSALGGPLLPPLGIFDSDHTHIV